MASSSLRSWKVQEINAHDLNVSCLALGQMSGTVLVTGGYDKKVNLWAIGSSTCIFSLHAHQSPVECVKFGHTEEFVCSGSQAGDICMWDLEAAKKVRTFTGHRDAIKTVEFHPYGGFLASGSLDSTVKLWDLRRNGCLSSYKGHTLTVNRVKFSPDGIWLASAGEDGKVRIWDVRVAKCMAELTDHEAAVLCVEFHPHEFLLASGSMDRSAQFYDLENFHKVSSAVQDSGPIRCLRFSNDGNCMYAGVEDYLKVIMWEPGRVLDSVSTGWGRVQDIAHINNQVIGASFHNSKVSLMTVDLKAVKTKPTASTKDGFTLRSASVRKSFSKEKLLPSSFTVKRNLEDSERSGGDTEEEGKFDSVKGFQPQRTLNRTPPPVPEVVEPEPEPAPQPKLDTDRSLPIRYETTTPEPEPLSLSSLDSNPKGYSYVSDYEPSNFTSVASSPPHSTPRAAPRDSTLTSSVQQQQQQTPRSPSPKQQPSPIKARRHSTSEQRRPALPDRHKPVVPSNRVQNHNDAETDFPIKMNNIRHSPSDPSLAKVAAPPAPTSRLRKASLNTQPDATPLSARQPHSGSSTSRPVSRPVLPVRPSPAPQPSPAYFTPPQGLSKLENTPDSVTERLGGINIEDFLPKSANIGTPYNTTGNLNVSELEAFSSLSSLHRSVMVALGTRQRNLQLVFSLWHNKDARTALDSAVSMNDQALIADLLGVMILRPNIWTLDICACILPSIEYLLTSKYEAYMTIGCSTLSLILRTFSHTIKSNILAPIRTVGVDISREERYQKSMRCYQNLVSIRSSLLKRQTLQGKIGQSFRELLSLMENLEN